MAVNGGPTPLRVPNSACAPHGEIRRSRDWRSGAVTEVRSDVPPPSSSHLNALSTDALTLLCMSCSLVENAHSFTVWRCVCAAFLSLDAFRGAAGRGFCIQHPAVCMCARRSPNMSSVSPVSRFNPHPAARLCPPPATANTRTGFIDGSSAEIDDFTIWMLPNLGGNAPDMTLNMI